MINATSNAIAHFSNFDIQYRLRVKWDQFRVTRDQPEPVPESTLKVFEAAIGRPLPATYRQFIAAYSDAYVSACAGADGSSPGAFYGLRENSGDSLIGEWVGSRDWLPHFIIPIADDLSCGWTICMNIDGPSFGEVSTCYSYEEPEVIASSFTDFLLRLEIDLS
ncbi:MAG: hypothetical protein ACI92S_000447 [Planctomycetaceae bacterium]|jgi:hypothetical protein